MLEKAPGENEEINQQEAKKINLYGSEEELPSNPEELYHQVVIQWEPHYRDDVEGEDRVFGSYFLAALDHASFGQVGQAIAALEKIDLPAEYKHQMMALAFREQARDNRKMIEMGKVEHNKEEEMRKDIDRDKKIAKILIGKTEK